MKNKNKKLTAEEKRVKRERKAYRKENFERIFINGKQKWIRKTPKIKGMDADEFIRKNSDPIWLQQNEMWEYMQPEENEKDKDK